MSDTTQLAAFIGVITSAVTALLTLACTKGIDAILKYRRDKREDKQQERQGVLAEESVAIEVYKTVVEQLTQRVTALEQQIINLQSIHSAQIETNHSIHLDCVKEQEQLRGEVNVLREQVERLKSHEVANQEHNKGLEKFVKELDAKIVKTEPK